MNYDLVNGLFEILAACFLTLNIFRIIKDKKIQGISWFPTGFFTLWGIWNLFYYPHLEQTLSFIGGIFLVIVNMIWIFLVFYYSRINKKEVSHGDSSTQDK